ncbi:hypothetical protein [Halomarina oriensis]|uniref:Uncharacterized protein n=1 Tax=Halomarina oriensis TaxID=671145 RepID=A0A6B0GSH9_9EURY|nr:hypothetical protein [Halomarina oriensis]MWG35055.1 hypothetical protein [Halomarina oriensis]
MAEDATSDRAGGGSSGGYVHEPTEFHEGDDEDDGRRTTRAYHPEVPQSEEFGASGWGLVAAIFLAFVVVPVAILLVPYSDPFLRSLGLTWRDAYLTLPLFPAMLLAALAVLVAVRD